MIIYQIDEHGKYIGEYLLTDSDKSPRSGQYILPGGCVTIEPPKPPEGMELYWQDGTWVLVDVPPGLAPETLTPEVSEDQLSIPTFDQRLTAVEGAILAVLTGGVANV